jgi:hypothetical protein
MNAEKLKSLQIAPEQKQRTSRPIWIIFLGILAVTEIAAYFAWGRAEDQRRIRATGVSPTTNALPARPNAGSGSTDEVVLTVSGYNPDHFLTPQLSAKVEFVRRK